MNEEEMIEALRNGAVLTFSDDGRTTITALDDLPPKVRECYRASMKHDRAHQQNCPECLEDSAENTLMDATSHRDDGNEPAALELEAKAEALRQEAARRRASASCKVDQ